MLEKYLQEIGLSDKEVAIYLSLLKVTSDTPSSLAQKTKIKRPTVYVILNSLAKKGLVSQSEKEKIIHYVAEPPERLETFLEQQRVTLEEHAKVIKDIIPQLRGLEKEKGERPIVKYFEGREGLTSNITSLWESAVKKNTPENDKVIYMLYSRDLVENFFRPEDRDKFKKDRLKANLRSKVIYSYSKGELTDNTGDRLKIDQNKYPIEIDMGILDDKIIINTMKDQIYSLFIRSKDIADSFRSLIDLVHDLSEKKKGGER